MSYGLLKKSCKVLNRIKKELKYLKKASAEQEIIDRYNKNDVKFLIEDLKEFYRVHSVQQENLKTDKDGKHDKNLKLICETYNTVGFRYFQEIFY